MIVFTPVNNRELPVIVQFGIGLIGTAIMQAITDTGLYTRQRYLLDWGNKISYSDLLDRIFKDITGIPYMTSVEVIWSAGRATFLSNEHETVEELINYKNIVGYLNSHIASSVNVNFTLMSSAGGLYEGQRVIGKETLVSPKRYYGFLKLKQEEYLLEQNNFLTKSIYRLSSIYGNVHHHHRMGLIPTLLKNGLANRETKIYGNLSTLRDYVLARDVGFFLVNQSIISKSTSCGENVFVLASGKPTSVHEIIKRIEALLNKRVFISVQVNTTNSEHITYLNDISPPNWKVTDLNLGIAEVLFNLKYYYGQSERSLIC